MPVVPASKSAALLLNRSNRKRWPVTRSAPTRSVRPMVRITNWSPTYARGMGVNGSPYFTEENTNGSVSPPRSLKGLARRLMLPNSWPTGAPVPLRLSCSQSMNSRKLPHWLRATTPTQLPGVVFQMSTICPLRTTAPVCGSWYVEPNGSMTWAPKRPWPQEWMPSTWSCQKTVPESTSLNQRYCTNSTPTGSPEGWVLASAWSSVSTLLTESMAVILRSSMVGSPWPTAMKMPTRSRLRLLTVICVAPAAAAAASVRLSVLNGLTDCSNERPVITPSEAWGSNCTKCVCMLTLESVPASVVGLSWLVSVSATQSPFWVESVGEAVLERMASGMAGFCPARIAFLSSFRTKSIPLVSVAPFAVSLIDRDRAVML